MRVRAMVLNGIPLAIEAGYLAATGLALYRGDPLLASLLLTSFVLDLEQVPVPGEVAYWVLGGALIYAHHEGESGAFFLAALSPIGRHFGMLYLLQTRASGRRWESYFLSNAPLPGWSGAVYAWRQRGRRVHRIAWVPALGIGLAWTFGLLWCAITWDSWWRLPYIAILAIYAFWWCALGLRSIRGFLSPLPETPRAEDAGSPQAWKANARRTYIAYRPLEAGGALPPAALAFASGFASPSDRRFRQFAADCAEHALPEAESATRKDVARVQISVDAARKRADGELRGWLLKTAFQGASSALQATGRRVGRERGDQATLRQIDDAMSAAYHALCAPTPLDAAVYAANSACMTVDGLLREDEHRWQLERLEWYRSQRENPA